MKTSIMAILFILIPLSTALTVQQGVELTYKNVTFSFNNDVSGFDNLQVQDYFISLGETNYTISSGVEDINISVSSYTNKDFYMIGENSEINYSITIADVPTTIIMNGFFYPNNFTSPIINTYFTYNINYNVTYVFRDMETNDLITNLVTATIYNNDFVESFNYTTTTGYLEVLNIPMSEYTISYSSNNYYSENYYFIYDEWDGNNITIYLVNNSVGENVTFIFTDKSTTLNLENVLLTVKKYVDGTYTTVQTINSDILGEVIISYIPNEYYCFIATKDGYDTQSFCVNSITTSLYNIQLVPSSTGNTDVREDDVVIVLKDYLVKNGTNSWAQVIFYSPTGMLDHYQLLLKTDDNQSIDTGIQSTGETFNQTIGINNASSGDILTIYASYVNIYGNAFTKTFYISIDTDSNVGLERFKYSNTGLSRKWAAIIATIIIIITCAVMGAATSAIGNPGFGAALGAIFSTGIFAYLNWIPDASFWLVGLIGGLYLATKITGD